MAVLCSQCGALIPRPDLSRTPLVCARCATARASSDDEDMLTVDAPPPASRPPSVARSIPPPSIKPPPGPTSVARPSVRPSVGGPPGSRIQGGGSRIPRATPSAAPRPLGASHAPRAGTPSTPSIPKAPAVPSGIASSASGKPTATHGVPAPRPVPKPEPVGSRPPSLPRTDEPSDFAPLETGDFEIVQAHGLAAKHPPQSVPEWDPDDEPTGDIVLETGDFESVDPRVPGPRR